MPALMIYNFGSGILRAVGDTKRPLMFLTAAGIINVVLNLFFVIAFGMGVFSSYYILPSLCMGIGCDCEILLSFYM